MSRPTTTIYVHHSPVKIGNVHSAPSFIAAAVHSRFSAVPARPSATRYFSNENHQAKSSPRGPAVVAVFSSHSVSFRSLHSCLFSLFPVDVYIYILRHCIITYPIVCAVRPRPAAHTRNTHPTRVPSSGHPSRCRRNRIDFACLYRARCSPPRMTKGAISCAGKTPADFPRVGALDGGKHDCGRRKRRSDHTRDTVRNGKRLE